MSRHLEKHLRDVLANRRPSGGTSGGTAGGGRLRVEGLRPFGTQWVR